MFSRIPLPALLLLAALCTGCQLGPAAARSGPMADLDGVTHYAPEESSKLIKEAAAEEIQESQPRPRTSAVGGPRYSPQAVPNSPLKRGS